VKNILLFLLLFFSISCSSNLLTNKPGDSIDCPPVFFASEHRNYIDSEEKPITLDNLSFKAEINNYAFNKICFQKNDIFTLPVEILLIISPINVKTSNISLPLYVALLDTKQQLIEIQYFSINGELRKDFNSGIYLETELSKTLNIILSKKYSVSSLVIGFMLDKSREELFN